MKVIGGILIAVTIVAGVWFDIVKMFVGGIEEIIRGLQVHPHSGHDIAWGAAHIAFAGIGTFVAFVLCVLWAFLFFGFNREPKVTQKNYRRQPWSGYR
jgi:hypothetical protein